MIVVLIGKTLKGVSISIPKGVEGADAPHSVGSVSGSTD